MRTLALPLLLAVGLAPAIAQASETRLLCGSMLDVESGEILTDRTLVVVDDTIVEVLEEIDSGDDARSIDLTDQTCLPGLMDMHTHFASELTEGSYIRRFTEDAPVLALRAADNARITLEAGFTTVRELGDSFDVSVALRDAIQQGLAEGPRIFTSAKSLATTGGHADPTNAYRDDLAGDPGPREGVINGPVEARKAVRQRYKDGADLIKITATGGVLSVARRGENPQFLTDEIEAVVETARDYDMHVAAHAHGAEGMKRSIRAGVASIEHGTLMEEEVMDLMIEHEVWYVPTISAGKFVAEKADVDGFFPELVRPKARELGPKIQETFGEAWRAGVPIAFGTDAGVGPHGDNAMEFVYMVETGYPEIDAIRSATLHAARLLDMEDELGQLAPDMKADVIAVSGNPLEDIETLLKMDFVMAAGRVAVQP